MSAAFDPYHKWLGIPPGEQPPNHYRLLGITLFETDADVIEAAADQRMIHLRTFQTGRHSIESQKLLNEMAAAKYSLLSPNRRVQYDASLRQQIGAETDRSNGATTGTSSRTAAPWESGPLDFMNSPPVFTRPRLVGRTKSSLNFALLTGAVVLAFAALFGAIKLLSDSDDADTDKARNIATTSQQTDIAKHPTPPVDARAVKTGGEGAVERSQVVPLPSGDTQVGSVPVDAVPVDPVIGNEVNVTIAAKSVAGYDLGPIHASTTIALEYRGGHWKSWGRRATSNPDAEETEGGDKCRLVIALPAVDGKPGEMLQMVPSGTAKSPFVWRADKDYASLVLRINDASGKGPGKVEYRVTIR
ncbi:MAG TPA: hypothetical protein VKB78_08550 [Pirellulales bacterium]|nr:hypothetical protein [Pirellulales bacterium]